LKSKNNKKKWRKWSRALHRDIGYFLVGITLVYAISGIILSHARGHNDPAFETIDYEFIFEKNLDSAGFVNEWEQKITDVKLSKFLIGTHSFKVYVPQGLGDYYPETGMVSFQTYEKNEFVYFINRLHNNQAPGWIVVADIYAGLLIFLALSGLIMVAGKNGFKYRGAIFMGLGLIFVFIFYFL
jgi:hypothetical protein